MGVLGSKEDLEQIVVIYGYNAKDLSWKESDNRSIYHTSGLIVNHNDKKYVISTRCKLISCQNIVMYYTNLEVSNSVLKNDLHILFQSIEYNIIILGTIDYEYLFFDKSILLSGTPKIDNTYPSYDINNNNKYLKPSKKTTYYTTKIDINLDSNITYDIQLYNVKYLKSIIYDESYLPNIFMYKFEIVDNGNDLVGIYGSPVFNIKHQLVGIVSKSIDKVLYILPTKSYLKIISYFINSISITVPLDIPFSYQIVNKKAIINNNYHILTTTGSYDLQLNDILKSVNNEDIIIKNKQIMIYDSGFKDYLPLDVYFNTNLYPEMSMTINIIRDDKNIEINALPVPYNNILLLSNQPSYHPMHIIPFVNLSNLIIVQLTQELLDIMACHQITIRNRIIDQFMDNLILERDCLLIIDCLDKNLINRYLLPELIIGRKKSLDCPIIVSINKNKINKLDYLIKMPHISNPKILIEYYNNDSVKLIL